MRFKKIISALLSATMVFSIGSMSAFAADKGSLDDGAYTATIAMQKDGETALSMCNGLFSRKADVSITGDTATINLYVANPIPMFPDGGKDGTLKDVFATYSGKKYDASIDITTKPSKSFDQTAMGINPGESHTCDIITLELPKASLNETHIDMDAFVNVAMNAAVQFDFILSDYEAVGGSQQPTSETKDVQVTATVAASQTTYSVTIPEAVAFGTLSTTEDTTKTVDITVDMVAGTDASKVRVSSQQNGKLAFGENKIAFANDFGTKDFANSGTKTATLTVAKENVKDKAVGDYTGTTTFTISTVQ